MTHSFRPLYLAACIIVLFFAVVGVMATAFPSPAAPHATSTPETAPDWTVAPCDWWAADSTPDLPPYTLPNVCVTPTGDLSTPTTPTP